MDCRHLTTFHVAGFQRYDGALVLKKLKPGKKLEMRAEPNNPYDPNAIALYRKGVMLGYIPRDENYLIAQMIRFGHDDVFECRILQVDPKAEPWHQVRVGVFITDRRDESLS